MLEESSLLLSVNAGSSSLKISLFRKVKVTGRQNERIDLLLTSSISSISSPPAKFSFENVPSVTKGNQEREVFSITDHATAFSHFLDVLKEASIDRNEIRYVCHRVVHGGDYTDPVIIDKESYHHIETLSALAPLYFFFVFGDEENNWPAPRHNRSALSVIQACTEELPSTKSVAYFDTAFHRSIPFRIASYAIDQKVAKAKRLKKYGFHGLSCKLFNSFQEGLLMRCVDAFILRSVAQHLQKVTPTDFILWTISKRVSGPSIP